jgi:hypothetical protein
MDADNKEVVDKDSHNLDSKVTKLPAPPQMLLQKLSDASLLRINPIS